jgi:hypothetical protein
VRGGREERARISRGKGARGDFAAEESAPEASAGGAPDLHETTAAVTVVVSRHF